MSCCMFTKFTLKGLLSFVYCLNVFFKAVFFSCCISTKFTLKGLLSFMDCLNVSGQITLYKTSIFTKFTLKWFCSLMDIISVFGQCSFKSEFLVANCTLFKTGFNNSVFVFFWNIKINNIIDVEKLKSVSWRSGIFPPSMSPWLQKCPLIQLVLKSLQKLAIKMLPLWKQSIYLLLPSW